MKKLRIQILLIAAVIVTGLGLTSCESDGPDERWYLNGTWQCMQYPDETLTFYLDGTGYWQNNYTGEYEDFDYYCDGDYLSFRWYPQYGPSYYEDCYIYPTNSNAIQITYPASSGYGPTTLYYSRIY